MDPLQHLQTEARNPASARLDELTSVEIVQLMASEDARIPAAVLACTREIAQAIEAIAERLGRGGRLVYIGAGTSGRLGVLDASECPPTFQTDPSQVIGLIAGGPGAMFQAVEGAEDSPALGEAALEAIHLGANDVLVGIAASGRTPFVLGGMHFARRVGAFTVGIACSSASPVEALADAAIVLLVGPEILTGSTRLKAGTATKLVLNMLTTGAMVRLGKTFGNLMVDLKATNEKLVARANRIVRTVAHVDEPTAAKLLVDCGGEVKTAIVAHLTGTNAAAARLRLKDVGGRVRLAIGGAMAVVPTTAARTDLVLGIDGGGTTTTVLLAARDGTIVGRGVAGPSNIQAVGVEVGLQALDDGIDRAFQTANLPRSAVAAICLGLAGIDRQEGLDVIHGWASRRGIAANVIVANDATLLLAAGTPDGWGLAVIAGTGSIAFVRSADGRIGRCGGWGYTLGDEGSAYMIALAGLRAACRAHDRVGPPTVLLDRFVKRMNLKEPPDLIPAVYRGPWDRTAIAGMAPLVLEAAAEGDAVARDIVQREASELARTAAGAVANHDMPKAAVPVALAGGVLLKSETYRAFFLEALRSAMAVGEVCDVPDPATGAVVLARRSLV